MGLKDMPGPWSAIACMRRLVAPLGFMLVQRSRTLVANFVASIGCEDVSWPDSEGILAPIWVRTEHLIIGGAFGRR